MGDIFEIYVCPHCGGINWNSLITFCKICYTSEDSPNGENAL